MDQAARLFLAQAIADTAVDVVELARAISEGHASAESAADELQAAMVRLEGSRLHLRSLAVA